jgi:FkbH-like protein
VLQFRLEDRFGDNGIVSVVVLRRPSPAAEVWEIANWVMSCRVFGRQLEDEIMNVVVEMARAQGIRELAGEFVPTERNGVVDSLYRTLGFSRTGADSEPASARAGRWVLRVDDYAVRQTSIARKVAA